MQTTLGSCVELVHGTSQTLEMRGELALSQSFSLAGMVSRYFGGGLVRMTDWMPGLTLRVQWPESTWLCDLTSPAPVIQELNVVEQLINHQCPTENLACLASTIAIGTLGRA